MHDFILKAKYNYYKFRYQLYMLAQHSDILTRTVWDRGTDYPKRVCRGFLTMIFHPFSWRKLVRQSLEDYKNKRRQQEAPARCWAVPSQQELAEAISEMQDILRKAVVKVAANDE